MRTRVSLSVVYILLITPPASADFVGVTTVNPDDPDTDFQCTQGYGAFVPGPLTVCNVYARFSDPAESLLALGTADLQVYNGAKPDIFFSHPFNYPPSSPACAAIPAFPDLICDSFVTIGLLCRPNPPDTDGTYVDGNFSKGEFNFNGHIVGGWFNEDPDNDQGDAGNYPNLEVLFLHVSMAPGLSMSGDIDIFWEDSDSGETIAEVDFPIERVAVGGCQDPKDCDDGNACTDDICADGVCSNPTISCPNDGNECTDDVCDPDIGCVHIPNNNECDDGDACTENDTCGEDGCVHGTPVQCPKGQVCDPANGKCIEADDPCECVSGRVTLCHISRGNLGNPRTITVGCAARDKHLAHGDVCGPCE